MNTHEIIGQTITDIYVWVKMKFGGLDKAEVFIELDNDRIIGVPWDFDSEIIEKDLRSDSESLFSDLNDTPVYHINIEEKSINAVLDNKKKRESSFRGRIKKSDGLGNDIPEEYRVHKTEYIENKVKNLKNRTITDFLIVEDSDSVGFLELENGYIITETAIAPHGTGKAGLNVYESLKDFEKNYGKNYKRIKDINT